MRFGEQLGELLHHRAILRDDLDRSGVLQKIFSIGELNLYRKVGMVLSLMKRRLDRVDSLLEGMKTPIIVYDIFGRVRECSVEMLNILSDEDVAPYEMTALDTLVAVTGEPVAKLRKYLRQVILDHQNITLRVRLSSRQGSKFLLALRPFVDGGDLDTSGEPAPFGTFGFCLELVDTTAVEKLTEMKAELSQRLGIQVRNNLAAIQMSSALLANEKAPQEMRQEAGDLLDNKIQSTVDIMGECQDYLALELEAPAPQRGYPLSFKPILSDVLSELKADLDERRVGVTLDEPALMNQVFADEAQVRTVLRSVFTYLLRDALDDTNIHVTITEAETSTSFRVSNEGYGIPEEDLTRYLSSDGEVSSDDVRGLQDGMRWVTQWGGSFEAHSRVGEGTEFRCSLRRFL
jgi:signal transduction histidine kinase